VIDPAPLPLEPRSIQAIARRERRRITDRPALGLSRRGDQRHARTTAAVLAGLPVLGIGLGQLIGADPLHFLLSDGPGGWLLAAGVTLACCGLLWSDRITAGAVA